MSMGINSICPSIGWINRNISKYESPLQWHEARPSITFNQCDVIMSGLIWSVHSTWGTVKLFWSPSPQKKLMKDPRWETKCVLRELQKHSNSNFLQVHVMSSLSLPKTKTQTCASNAGPSPPSPLLPKHWRKQRSQVCSHEVKSKYAYRRLPRCHQARCHGLWSSAPSSCPAGTPCPSRARTPWAPRWHLRHCVPV